MKFFKVFLPCRSSTHLRIPPAFVKNFNDKFPKQATLKDTNGILWSMKIEKDEDGVLSLKHGWPRFVTDHCLKYGDFLVFRYNGNSLFDVDIFGTNGCIKNQGSANRRTNEERRMIPLPVKLEDELNEGGIRKSIRSCKRKSTEESSSSSDATQRKSRRITMNTSEPSKATDSSDFATTKNPNFVDHVRPQTPYHLNIPGSLVTENSLKFEQEMFFCTQNGSWPVTVSVRKDGRHVFGKGWNKFWVENNLEPQDKCRFEFVFRKKKKLSPKILVTIIRAKTRNEDYK